MCIPVMVHKSDTNQLLFSDKKELNLLISDYFMLHLMIGEKDSVESFTGLCHSLNVRYFDGNCVKITLLHPDEDLFRRSIVKK